MDDNRQASNEYYDFVVVGANSHAPPIESDIFE